MTTDEGRSEGEDMSEPFVTVLREIRDNPNSFSLYVIASWCDKAADLLEANAAEIATANALMDDMCTRIEGLEAENEKLRAVYEAVDAAIKDEHEQGHDLDDLTPLWADVEQALAAVEQSEAGDELLEISGKPGTEERADLYSADTQSKGSPDAWL